MEDKNKTGAVADPTRGRFGSLFHTLPRWMRGAAASQARGAKSRSVPQQWRDLKKRIMWMQDNRRAMGTYSEGLKLDLPTAEESVCLGVCTHHTGFWILCTGSFGV